MDPIIGSGYPEGKVHADVDTLYLDVGSGVFYYKGSSSGAADPTGWIEAGASSPDHSFPDGASVVDVSGYKRYRTSNNSITNFTGGRDQQVIFLIVDKNSSIQANANIADAFSGPGRCAYMLDSGRWYQVVLRGNP
ncbi:MAG: hypothetical protein WB755_09080 [Terriglobales bacterium]